MVRVSATLNLLNFALHLFSSIRTRVSYIYKVIKITISKRNIGFHYNLRSPIINEEEHILNLSDSVPFFNFAKFNTCEKCTFAVGGNSSGYGEDSAMRSSIRGVMIYPGRASGNLSYDTQGVGCGRQVRDKGGQSSPGQGVPYLGVSSPQVCSIPWEGGVGVGAGGWGGDTIGTGG